MDKYKVKSRWFGDVLHFEVEAEDLKEAYEASLGEAKRIFSYTGVAEPPNVEVKKIEG